MPGNSFVPCLSLFTTLVGSPETQPVQYLGRQVNQPVDDSRPADRQETDLSLADHEKPYRANADPGTTTTAKRKTGLLPFLVISTGPSLVFTTTSRKAKGHPGHGNDYSPILGLNRVADDGIDVHHFFDALHGGLHQSLDWVLWHHPSTSSFSTKGTAWED